jgi:hypothetical protein
MVAHVGFTSSSDYHDEGGDDDTCHQRLAGAPMEPSSPHDCSGLPADGGHVSGQEPYQVATVKASGGKNYSLRSGAVGGYMAKRGRRPVSEGQLQGSRPTPPTSGSKLEDFAEDLGRLLGSTKAKAEGWLGQRQNVAKQLEQIRDTASDLLNQLSGGRIGSRKRPGRPPKKAMGPRANASGAFPRRKLSAKARAAISRAQKKRWAKLKAER